MKNFLEKIIRRRNPQFRFDPHLSSRLLLLWFLTKAWAQARALRLLWSGHNPFKRFLGKGVRFFNARNMSIGEWTQLEEGVYLSALGHGPLVLGNGVRIGAYSRLVISTSFNNLGDSIHIGNNVGIGEFAYLGGAGGLKIGDDCIIGQYLSCHPENHRFNLPNKPIRLQGVDRQGIQIGSNCWIGAKVTLLDGVTIGANCVVAAGAVVTKSMPPNSLIGGVPARVLRPLYAQEKKDTISTMMY